MVKTLGAKLGIHILEIEITSRCNLNCKHCYNRNNKIFDLPFDKFVELYRFANNNKVWRLVISGGEALLHPNFNKIVSFIRKNKHYFELVLQTNGTLIDDDSLDKLKAFDLIHISYDIFNDLRKHGDKNIELAKKLKKEGIKCYLFSTISKTNQHFISNMVKVANSAGIPIGFNLCVPTKTTSQNFILNKKETMEAEQKLYILSLKNKTLRYTGPLSALFDKNKKGEFKGTKGGCLAGVASCVVGFDGYVYPCPFLRIKAGNIFKSSLKDIWLNSKLFKKFRFREKFSEPCCSCEFLSYCGGCRGRAYKKTKSLTGHDPMCYKRELSKSTSF